VRVVVIYHADFIHMLPFSLPDSLCDEVFLNYFLCSFCADRILFSVINIHNSSNSRVKETDE